MKKKPMHPFFRLVTIGIDPDEAEQGVEAFEKHLGPLNGLRAKIAFLCVMAPAFVAGGAVVYFELYNYAMLILAALIAVMILFIYKWIK
jgi:hypothetical protein